jgi:hypothetical protein
MTRKRHVLVFGEQRNSDRIFLDRWSGSDNSNPPNIRDKEYTDEVYNQRKLFGPLDISEVQDAIVDTINEWVLQSKNDNAKVTFCCMGCGNTWDTLESAKADLAVSGGCPTCSDCIVLGLDTDE